MWGESIEGGGRGTRPGTAATRGVGQSRPPPRPARAPAAGPTRPPVSSSPAVAGAWRPPAGHRRGGGGGGVAAAATSGPSLGFVRRPPPSQRRPAPSPTPLFPPPLAPCGWAGGAAFPPDGDAGRLLTLAPERGGTSRPSPVTPSAGGHLWFPLCTMANRTPPLRPVCLWTACCWLSLSPPSYSPHHGVPPPPLLPSPATTAGM